METSKELYHQMLGLGSDWEVSSVELDLTKKQVEIRLAHLSEDGFCSVCEQREKVYDYSAERTWRHLDTMQFATEITAKPPRVNCSKCGKVKTSFLPWAAKNSGFTLLFETFAIQVLQVAKSIEDARKLLRLSWHQNRNIMEKAVERGLVRREAEDVPFIGMDEKNFRSGHSYITVLNDLEKGRVLEVSEGRSCESAETVLTEGLTPEQREMVCGVCIDMSAPFIKAIKKHLQHADIVHDKFHIVQHLTNAVDLTRRQENRKLVKQGNKVLVGTKYDWLRNKMGMSETELHSIHSLETMELEVSKTWYLKELFTHFWKKRDAENALKFFGYWAKEVLESGNKHMWKVVKMIYKHIDNILSYFDSYITNAVSEGLNSKIQSIKANARGFRSFANYRVAILFYCAQLNLAP